MNADRFDRLSQFLAQRRLTQRPVPESTDERAPDFALPELSGGQLTLADLFALANPLLHVFTDPHCGPCYELLPDIGGQQYVYADRLTVVLVSSGDPATNRAMTAEYGIHPVLLQRELELVKSYALVQAPAAAVLPTA